ncbi:MAG: MATE family efflux transporter, partial [Gammaproteobacteria bacterium]|nr:MATE family efflux transporter [Gammaproteobacteria bacterium]
PERAGESAWHAAKYNAAFMTGVGVFMLLFAPWIAGLFSNDPEVINYAISCLRILGIGYPMYAIGMIMIQSLNGAGDTATPSLLNFVCFWLLQIPLAYWLATMTALGPNGVFIAIVVSESLLTVLGVIAFRSGRWRQKIV